MLFCDGLGVESFPSFGGSGVGWQEWNGTGWEVYYGGNQVPPEKPKPAPPWTAPANTAPPKRTPPPTTRPTR